MYLREFTGGVFSQRIEGGRAGAAVELSQTEVTAITPDGQRFSLPFSNCQVDIGGESGRMIFCRNQDRSLTIFCEDKTFPDALSVASFGLLDDQLRNKLRVRRSEKWADRRFAVWLMFLVVLVGIGCYFGVLWAARAAIHAVPISVDAKIGNQVYKAMDLGDEIKDPKVVAAMQGIVDKLAPHAAVDGIEFHVHVIKSEEVNAFALPGGPIVVFSGLIEQAERPEQIAGVLGHEMAHATLRHGLERISHAVGVGAAVGILLGDVQGIIMTGVEILQFATLNSYSRDQEGAADREGVRMLYEAGIDPLALTEFFESLHEEHGDMPGAISWLSTHPQHKQRIAAVKAQLAELPPKKFEPLDIDLDELKKLIKEK
jgi:Zn-dependent protease with chaperone function